MRKYGVILPMLVVLAGAACEQPQAGGEADVASEASSTGGDDARIQNLTQLTSGGTNAEAYFSAEIGRAHV